MTTLNVMSFRSKTTRMHFPTNKHILKYISRMEFNISFECPLGAAKPKTNLQFPAKQNCPFPLDFNWYTNYNGSNHSTQQTLLCTDGNRLNKLYWMHKGINVPPLLSSVQPPRWNDVRIGVNWVRPNWKYSQTCPETTYMSGHFSMWTYTILRK